MAIGWALCLSLDRTGAGLKTAPNLNLVALFLGVWVIYLFDRLLDVSRISSPELLTKRHQWARSHITLISSLGVMALGVLLVVIVPRLEWPILLISIVPGLITLVYYLLFRGSRLIQRPRQLPYKEMTVAICFVLGISISVTTDPPGGIYFILMGGMALLFSGNCLLIARAERNLDRCHDPAAHYACDESRRAPRLPEILVTLAMILSLPVVVFGGIPHTSLGLAACALLTFLLARAQKDGDSDLIQMKADGILMIPLLIALLEAGIFR